MKPLFFFAAILLCFAHQPVLADEVAGNSEPDYRTLEVLTDVLSLVRGSYVEEVNSQELIYGAVRGMLATLDPHSSFMTPEMFEDMQAETHGEFGGLGIEITVRDGALVVVSPIEDTPADRVGMQAGDRIVEIDGESTDGMEVMEAVRLLRGPQGAEVEIVVRRAAQENQITFNIVRDIIQIKSVKSRLLDNNYGYVRLSQFQERTAEDLKQHLSSLREEAEDFNGLVVDLRNNPGGLLDQAVAVADLFLDHGLVVYTEGREADAKMEFSASQKGTEPSYPIVVLINGGSASAAEIVAGALQDYDRAIIMGEQSFGKGSVQTIIPLDDRSALRLTTARYFTPSGRSIQATGITPDIIVSQMEVSAEESPANQLREEDLQNHFQPLTPDAEEENSDSGDEAGDEQWDYQLQRALELLKGLEIFNRGNQAA
jgi:carboxyl-terminal processing protease